MDGAGQFRMFFQIVFPLLKTVTATIVVLNSMFTWNDFLVPMLLINRSPRTRTLTLATLVFYGKYSITWNTALAGLVLTVIPILIVFMVLQRYIVKGIAVGAVKS